MPPPKAYFLTWSTYGSHLRGDPESTDHARAAQGARRLPELPALADQQRKSMNHPEFRLSEPARDVVEEAIREHGVFKNWRIFALAVRSNHVHLLLNSSPLPPERVMLSCKARATRALREAGLIQSDQKVWTRHGSTRWINDDASLEAAYAYITQAQDGPVAAKRYQKKPLPPGHG